MKKILVFLSVIGMMAPAVSNAKSAYARSGCAKYVKGSAKFKKCQRRVRQDYGFSYRRYQEPVNRPGNNYHDVNGSWISDDWSLQF